MKESNRMTRFLLAFVCAIVTQAIIVGLFLLSSTLDSIILTRLTVLMGGDVLNGGYIQFLTFLFFYWGAVEIYFFTHWAKFERKYLKTDILPFEEHAVLGPTEINKIRLTASNYIKKKRSETLYANLFLLNIIKKACTKFRSNNSSESAFLIVESQSRLNKEKSESEQSGVRYLLWAIPSIGFIGTILGISNSLSIAATGDIDRITYALGLAFDTTLLALVLSLILMYFYHGLQELVESMHQEIEEYVIENLINKIDVG